MEARLKVGVEAWGRLSQRERNEFLAKFRADATIKAWEQYLALPKKER